MLSISSQLRIFLCAHAVDMRLGYNGLSGIVESGWLKDPVSGDLFVFVNKKRNRMKILVWDNGGFWLLAKRLECGIFPVHFETANRSHLEIERSSLSAILDGVEILSTRRKKRYKPLTKIE